MTKNHPQRGAALAKMLPCKRWIDGIEMILRLIRYGWAWLEHKAWAICNELRMREALTTHGYFYSSNVDCLPQSYIESVTWQHLAVTGLALKPDDWHAGKQVDFPICAGPLDTWSSNTDWLWPLQLSTTNSLSILQWKMMSQHVSTIFNVWLSRTLKIRRGLCVRRAASCLTSRAKATLRTTQRHLLRFRCPLSIRGRRNTCLSSFFEILLTRYVICVCLFFLLLLFRIPLLMRSVSKAVLRTLQLSHSQWK